MKRILVASDRGPLAGKAVAQAIRLAARAGAELRIVHAATESGGGDGGSATLEGVLGETRRMTGALTDLPLKISARIRLNPPAQAILEEARAFDADVIVLGAHGPPRLRDALFGTTGTDVVRHSDRPILIVRNEGVEPYSKVLVAIDDPQLSRPILDTALDLAPAAELFAVHAFYPTLRQTVAGPDALAGEEEREKEELERLMTEATAGRPASRPTANRHAVVETGEVLTILMRKTEEIAPDLVVMGTRPRATYLGSHAVDTLFWCPNDMLVVPIGESAEGNS